MLKLLILIILLFGLVYECFYVVLLGPEFRTEIIDTWNPWNELERLRQIIKILHPLRLIE